LTPQRQALLTALIQHCTTGAQGAAPILGQVQLISQYNNAAEQCLYVESYLPKQVGCWRYIRQKVHPQQLTLPTISIGAGPRLCLWGWFFDVPPPDSTIIRAVDVLDWSVTRSAPFIQAEWDVFGGATVSPETGLYFPEDFVATQCAKLPGINPFISASITTPSWVLFPFVFGHLLDRDGKISLPQMALLGQRVRKLLAADHVLIVVDKAAGTKGADWFWTDLVERSFGYSMPQSIPVFDFAAQAAEFAACYQDPAVGAYRIGTTRASGFALSRRVAAPIWIT
jgi:hypothetical protein